MPSFLCPSPHPLFLPLLSPSTPQSPVQSILHQPHSNTPNKQKKKTEESSCTSKAQQGKHITTPLTLNSPTRNHSKTRTPQQNINTEEKNPWNKQGSDFGNGNARVPKEQGEKIVEFFWETGRLPTREEVKNFIYMENGRDPVKDGVEAFGFLKKWRRPPVQEEIVDFDYEEIGRIPTNEQVGIVDFDDTSDRLVSEEVQSLNFEEIGRTPRKDRLESSDSLETNGSLLAQREVRILKVGGNERIPVKEQMKIVHSFWKNGRTPTTKNVGSSYSDEGTGRSGVLDYADRHSGTPTQERVEVISDVKKISKVTIQEQEELSYGRIGTLHLLDIVERIQSLPSGESVDILHFFRNNGDILRVVDINNLLIAFIKADKPEYVVNVFSQLSSYGISPDIRTFSIMIQCYCKNNDPDEARRVLDSMIENGFSPNVITFTVLVNCFCKKGRLQKAFEIFEIMNQLRCEPNIQTYNCLINGLCYVGRVEEANDLLTKIKHSSKKPDIYTFTVVMDGFCRVGRADEGKELLEDAIKMGLQPTAVTFNTLFNGYCKEGRPFEGINLLKQMKEMGSQPDYISYSTLLHGLLIWDEVLAALQIYKEMSRVGFKADNRMMNALLIGLCQKSSADRNLLNDAEELFQSMKEMECWPAPYTYSLIIQVLSSRGQTDKALTNLREMIEIGCLPRATAYNAVIRALCSEGRANEAWLVLVRMIQQRRFPSRDSYSLIFNEFYQQGRVLDAFKVHALMVKRGISFYGKAWEDPVSEKKPMEMASER